jgi:hypothetical protein
MSDDKKNSSDIINTQPTVKKSDYSPAELIAISRSEFNNSNKLITDSKLKHVVLGKTQNKKK